MVRFPPPSERRLAAQRANAQRSADQRRKPKICCCCENCGRTFYVSQGRKNNPNRFCSNPCRYEFMRGANGAAAGPRPDMVGDLNPNWRGGQPDVRRITFRQDGRVLVWKRIVINRDRRICQLCGLKTDKPRAHHILLWSFCEETRFDPENGVCLCPQCHAFVHSAANFMQLYIAFPVNKAAIPDRYWRPNIYDLTAVVVPQMPAFIGRAILRAEGLI